LRVFLSCNSVQAAQVMMVCRKAAEVACGSCQDLRLMER
jgi:hypothetical protein